MIIGERYAPINPNAAIKLTIYTILSNIFSIVGKTLLV